MTLYFLHCLLLTCGVHEGALQKVYMVENTILMVKKSKASSHIALRNVLLFHIGVSTVPRPAAWRIDKIQENL